MLSACAAPYGNQSPLIRAITENKPKAVQALLNRGANANQTLANGTTALMVAASVGNREIVTILLSHHAKLNIHNQDGSTALLTAAGSGNSDVAKLLIKHGANPCQKK